MTEDSKPTIHRPVDDPLGYDTRRPFRAVARQMAEDALAGWRDDAVDAELVAVRKRWGIFECRTGTKP